MGFLSVLFSRRGAALLCAALLSACTVVTVDEPGPRPRPRPQPQFCPRIYDPVCAERRGDRQTFPNACEADAAGYRIIRDGQCRRGGNGTGGGFEEPRPPRPRPDPAPEEPRICTREYAPVCATRRGNVRTFGNSCEARAADYRIIDPNGPC